MLENILLQAHKALPEAISIGYWLVTLPEEQIYGMIEKMKKVIGGAADGRLIIQYTLYTLCAQEVI